MDCKIWPYPHCLAMECSRKALVHESPDEEICNALVLMRKSSKIRARAGAVNRCTMYAKWLWAALSNCPTCPGLHLWASTTMAAAPNEASSSLLGFA